MNECPFYLPGPIERKSENHRGASVQAERVTVERLSARAQTHTGKPCFHKLSNYRTLMLRSHLSLSSAPRLEFEPALFRLSSSFSIYLFFFLFFSLIHILFFELFFVFLQTINSRKVSRLGERAHFFFTLASVHPEK